MLPFTVTKPRRRLISDAVNERLAKLDQPAILKASTSTQLARPLERQTSTPKRSHTQFSSDNHPTDVVSDSEDDAPPTVNARASQFRYPSSSCQHQPRNFERASPLGPIGTEKSPTAMAPSLLRTALNVASPRSSLESRCSPLENATSGKRKRDHSPSIHTEPSHSEILPHNPVEEADHPKRRRHGETPLHLTQSQSSRAISPRSPGEEAPTQSAAQCPAVESHQSPVEEAAPHPQSAGASTSGLASSASTPQKQPVIANSEVSDRFEPLTIDGVEYRNPAKFSLSPPCWRRWSPKMYVELAEDLRMQYDPVPFARAHGITVEEVRHVYHAMVCNPMYAAKEAAKRGEEGMMEIVEMYRNGENAAVARPWGREEHEGGEKRWLGEITGVKREGVEITLARSGLKRVLSLKEMGAKDRKYLKEILTEGDKNLLRAGAGMKVVMAGAGSEA